ncbi:MAG: hypothetical protein IPJ30_23365 [Acidobacteria bacterium]|nr:hypothetical protein [Acidobacteriota bacterium]
MAKRTVKAGVGDSLCNIAYLNGFGDCKPFREEPANAYIVNRAVDPGQVLPGDVVTIPDFVKKDDGGGTEATHQYVRRGTLAKLRFVHGSVSTTVDNDTALTFLNVSNYITNQAGTADGNVAFRIRPSGHSTPTPTRTRTSSRSKFSISMLRATWTSNSRSSSQSTTRPER